MAYDVFLVTVPEDFDMAKLVARRLRTLKFTVRFNQKQTADDTFDAKDARDAGNSQSMLVLWSETAVKNDWVRAAAAVGNSRDGALVHAATDKTIPYEPYRKAKRFSLEGMTSRKTPEGFYKLVEELAARSGRSDLRQWMNFGAKDDEGREAWLDAHPDDPLAEDARKKREKALGAKPEPAAEAAPAATLAANVLKNGNGHGPKNGVSGAIARASSGARSVPSTVILPDEDPVYGKWTLAFVGGAIAAIFLFSLLNPARPLAPSTAAMPGVGNAYDMVAACPAGTVPRSLLEILEPGPIIDDTTPLEHGPIIDDTTPPSDD